MKKLLSLFSIMLVSIAITSCDALFDSDDDTSAKRTEEVKSPFAPYDEGTSFTASGTLGSMGDKKMEMVTIKVGDREIGGKLWDKARLAYDIPYGSKIEDDNLKGLDIWGHIDTEKGTIEIIAYEDRQFLPSILGTSDVPSTATLVLDAPITINLNAPVGEKQYIDATGTLNSEIFTDEKATASGYFKVVAKDVTVAGSEGTVFTDCKHIEFSATVAGDFLKKDLNITNLPLSGSIYVHEVFGTVKTEINLPAGFDPISVSLDGETDWGDAEVGWNVIQKMEILSSKKTTYKLSTYDRIGEIDANKNEHAKMLIELRWANEEDAKNHAAPHPLMCRVEFNSLFGYFPHTLIESPISIFHPEENGKGYKYWYAFVDQAQKNSGDGGKVYKINVQHDASLPPIRITGRIGYDILPPEKW